MITTRDAVEADLPNIVEICNLSIPGGRATADTSPITVRVVVSGSISWIPAVGPSGWQRKPGRSSVASTPTGSTLADRRTIKRPKSVSTWLRKPRAEVLAPI